MFAAASLLVLAVASIGASATPLTARQDPENGSCAALNGICARAVDSKISNPWNVPACLFAVGCGNGAGPQDYINRLAASKGVSAPNVRNLPRVSSSAFNSISKDGKTITQQNYIDAYYGTLDQVGGPYPTSAQPVILNFNYLQSWTGFCNAAIPYKNLADLYQYGGDSIAPANGGAPCQSGPVTSSSSARPTTSTVRPTSTAVTTTVTVTPTPRPVSNDPSCNAIYNTCKASVDPQVTNPWAVEACLIAASCYGGPGSNDNFLSILYRAKGNGGSPSKSANVPRVGSAAFSSISSDGTDISQQNYIDAFYSVLGQSNGPYPSSPNAAIGYFKRLATWTSYCNAPIPASNFGDYFQYSASNLNTPGCTH